MEAVTLQLDEYHTHQVIQADIDYGAVQQIITASLNDTSAKSLTITSMTSGRKPRHITLGADAMTALVKLWGTPQESETAKLHSQIQWLKRENDGLKTGRNKAIDERDKIEDAYEAACELNETLHIQITTMQSQESFHMALMQSVVDAARMVSGFSTPQQWSTLREAITALDAWQPDDASTDVSAAVAMVDICMFCGTKRGDPHKPSCEAFVPTVSAAVASKLCRECGRSNGHDLHCKNEDDDAEWRDAPVAPGVCPECNYGDGAHSMDCSIAEDLSEEMDAALGNIG